MARGGTVVSVLIQEETSIKSFIELFLNLIKLFKMRTSSWIDVGQVFPNFDYLMILVWYFLKPNFRVFGVVICLEHLYY